MQSWGYPGLLNHLEQPIEDSQMNLFLKLPRVYLGQQKWSLMLTRIDQQQPCLNMTNHNKIV